MAGRSGRAWAAVVDGNADALARLLGTGDHSPLREVAPALAELLRHDGEETDLDAWRYRVDWRPVTLPHHGRLSGTWLVVNFAVGRDVRPILDAIGSRGARAVSVPPETATDPELLRDMLGDVEQSFAGVVVVLGGADNPPACVVDLVRAALDASAAVPLWLVTSGSAGVNDQVPDPAQAAVWGLGQVVALEHPDLWGGLVDLPVTDFTADLAERLVAVVAADTDEDQLALQPGGIHVRRIVRAAGGAPAGGGPVDTVVLTGAGGSIGPDVARWLVAEGARDLVLVSRTAPTSSRLKGLCDELAGSDVMVTLAACDVTDGAAVRALFDGLAAAGRPVRTVLHAAADMTLGALADLDAEQLGRTVAAKIDGAHRIVEALDPADPATVVLFSSIAGVWGSGNHGAYAAANAYIDAYAHRCRAAGLPVTSLAWGIWNSAAAPVEGLAPLLRRQGVVSMDPHSALPGLRAGLAGAGGPAEIVADIDWSVFLPVFSAMRQRPLFRDFAGPDAVGPIDRGDAAPWQQELQELPLQGRVERATQLVATQLRAILALPPDGPVDADQPLREFGLDSMMAVELRNRLQRSTGLMLLTTVVFDHPTVAALAGHLLDEAAPAAPTTPGVALVRVQADDDPIVIVGMACHLPGGVTSPDELWRMVMVGTDAIGPLPADRGWPIDRLCGPAGTAGSSVARGGGFLAAAADFDAELFGISPREAVAMDPQQRLLLETCWEALERAGLDPTGMRGEPIGVYVGASAQTYGLGLGATSEAAEAHLITGNAASVMSGRISYTFGFSGPALTVDTACSSSLVALHLAAQAIRLGECRSALAGGVTVMASGMPLSAFSRHGALAADGRCKAFADEADGIGLAEGAGVVVLERLSDAVQAGHPVLAVLLGSAVNQDGTSNGLTAPSGSAQRRVIEQALANARLGPADVDVVEAHGTGTPLGDPIEASALLAVYGARTSADPLWVGSVKSNIGHTQAAAGITGVIKTVLTLGAEVLPRTLHSTTPSTRIDWTSGAVRLLTSEQPWPRTGRPRRGAVSSFGISGTNAHVILEQPPIAEAVPQVGRAAVLPGRLTPFVVSGAGTAALRAQADALRVHLASASDEVFPVARALAGRPRLPHRALVLAADRAELITGLQDLAESRTGSRLVRGEAGPSKVAFIFPGQGSQWVGMARELLESSSTFRGAFEECEAALEHYLDHSVLGSVLGDPGAPPLDRLRVVQPALFATLVSLAHLWRSCGVEPAAVIGHSQGEVAAAHIAGALTLDDAARIAAVRSLAQDELAGPDGHGAMASVRLSVAEVERAIAAGPDDVVVAAVNAPDSVTVSGANRSIEALVEVWEKAGVRARRVNGAHVAGHSPLIEPALARCRTDLADITATPGCAAFYSTVTGGLLPTSELDGAYWVRNMREPVQFDRAVRALCADNATLVIEISPHPLLIPAIEAVADAAGHRGVRVVESLRRGEDSRTRFLTSLAEADVAGAAVDWAAVVGSGPSDQQLPTYAFRRSRYWLADQHTPGERTRSDALRTYRAAWTSIDVPARPADVKTWTILYTPVQKADPMVAAVEDTLRSTGAAVHRVVCEPGTEIATANVCAAGGVLSLLGLDERPDRAHATATTVGSALTAELIRTLPASGLVWAITRGAVMTGPSDPTPEIGQAQVWAMARVAALDHANCWGGVLDLSAVPDENTQSVVASVLAQRGEDQLALRGGRLLARRLEPAAISTATVGNGQVWDGATVVVIGAATRAGAEVVRWIVEGGAHRVVLPGPEAQPVARIAGLLAELGGQAATIETPNCDIADAAAVQLLLENLHAKGAPISVVHAEDVDGTDEPLNDGSFHSRMDTVTSLDVACRAVPIQRFVLGTSVAGILGSPQATVRAAADTAAEIVVQRRRADGLPGIAVAWGPWALGRHLHDPETTALLRRHGFRAMSAPAALIELDRLVAAEPPPSSTTLVADVDWSRLAVAFTASRPSPLLASVAPAAPAITVAAPDTTGVTDDQPLTGRLATMSPIEAARTLRDVVRRHVLDVLGHGGDPGSEASTVTDDRAFRDLGFDSVTAVDLRNRLRADTGLAVPATVVFDHPNIDAVVGFLMELAGVRTGDVVPPEPPVPAVHDDPVVIVGVGCRFPGGIASAEDLWRLVQEGRDAITGFPSDRGWETEAAGLAVRAGGFLPDAADFDAALFGISPREALAMDPQQRLLLETSWEALEDAGIDPTSLRGAPVGTYVGSSYRDYESRLREVPDELRGFLGNGSAASVMSGRVAYLFGLVGPALTVDTACSSSLVALHLAAQALRSGECSMALAGGVTVMSAPGLFVEFERQGALARDGRCKPFAAAADGMGISEGVGMLVLERFSDARRLGHDVLAVIAGSAVNQDGASNGMTAPSGPAQQRVIRSALANASIGIDDVDVVEAHGTGTVLGDPIEAGALIATYGRQRTAAPLWLGSVKSNLGHTGAAAGVAGVIKMVMAMRNGTVPQSLHIAELSPHVDWTAGRVRLAREAVPWPAPQDRPRRAGISSFGLSGTNAHVLLEQAPPASEVAREGRRPGIVVWPVSGRGETALAGQSVRLLEWLGESGSAAAAADVGVSLARRAALSHRAVVWGPDRDVLSARLAALTRTGPVGPGSTSGTVSGSGLGWVFSGQGGQRSGMGLALAAQFAVVDAAFDEVDQELLPWSGRAIRELLGATDDELGQTGLTQLAVFAVQVGLARLWESWGVLPTAVAGHSVGELAAVYVAGGLSLASTCALVGQRARLMGELPAGGAMAALAADQQVAEELIAGLPDVVVAAVNGPSSLVVSGPERHVEEVAAAARARGVRARRLRVSHAFHSPAMDPVLARYREVVTSVLDDAEQVGAFRIPVVSSSTGAVLSAQDLRSPGYWVDQLRQPVRFANAVHGLLDRGLTRFLEIGPDASVTPAVQECGATIAVASLRRDRNSEPEGAVEAAARLFVSGVDIDWAAVNGVALDPPARPVRLPSYAFQRSRFWLDTGAPPAVDSGFWESVRSGNGAGLAAQLGVPETDISAVLPALAAWSRTHRTGAADIALGLTGLGHRVAWVPIDMAAAPAPAGGVLVTDTASTASCADLHAVLEASGTTSSKVMLPEGARPEDVSALLGPERPATVVVTISPASEQGRSTLLAVAQAVTRMAGPRLWLLTRDAVDDGDAASDPWQAWTWGLGRSVAREHPASWGGLIDVPVGIDRSGTHLLCELLAGAGGGEDQLAVRSSGVLARRLRPAPIDSRLPSWPLDGTTLVTGGTGGLGTEVARGLARAGVPRLLLASRQGPDAPGAAALVNELRALGTHVDLRSCDVTQRHALTDLVADMPARQPLRAVVHTAGVLRDGLLDTMTPADIEDVLAAKAGAALLLHELTADLDLAAFVLFSSLAGVAGSAGQANYAAANAVLDALARYRRRQGMRALSVAWGGWDGGMATDAGVRERARRTGMGLLAPAVAVTAMLRVANGPDPDPVIADVDWPVFAMHTGRPDLLLSELLPAGAPAATDDPPFAEQICAVSPGQARHMVQEAVREHAAAVLGHEPGAVVDPSVGFLDIGFTSLSGVELRNRLESVTGVALPKTLIFDHPTAADVVDLLIEQLTGIDRRPLPGRSSDPDSNSAGEDLDIDVMDTEALLRAAAEWGDEA
ncbi:type I polyketide synthase [uncultured Pseudonocardia sp.]|uniref:type I polyketide synthase n=1 Tax=uncultured Pseudonocardia sp. TaxID=211455 RepID=UPI00260E8E5E|nr:type I polyketide synthase [uncultured Pseudonocardia sp.]